MRHDSQPAIEIRIDGDENIATLIVPPNLDPSSFDLESILHLIQSRSVAIDPESHAKVEQAIASYKSNSAAIEMEIARRVPPVHGKDGEICWQPGCDPVRPSANNATGAAPAPAQNNSQQEIPSKVDYYNQAHYAAAAAGAHIATILPPQPGVDGRDLSGRKLAARQGSPFPIRTDPTVTIDSDGKIVSTIDGVIHYKDRFLSVTPLFQVAGSVNFSTGNIVFAGCVEIRGDICDRFIVRAGQDVSVQGLVGAATVICGRNLAAPIGMAAHDRGCLFVCGDAQVGYLKNVRGIIQGNLNVRREIINCEIAVGQNLYCESGALIGGTVSVAGAAVLGTLGSATGTPTTIVFGTHSCQREAGDLARSQVPTAPALAPGVKDTSGAGAVKSANSASAESTKPAGGVSGLTTQQIAAQVAQFAEKVRGCVDQSCAFHVGGAKNVDLLVQKALHAGAIIRTGRCRVAIAKTLQGPIRIRGNQADGLSYQMGDGVWHPLTDLARTLNKAG